MYAEGPAKQGDPNGREDRLVAGTDSGNARADSGGGERADAAIEDNSCQDRYVAEEVGGTSPLWASYRQGEAAYSLSKYSLSGSGSIPFLPLGRERLRAPGQRHSPSSANNRWQAQANGHLPQNFRPCSDTNNIRRLRHIYISRPVNWAGCVHRAIIHKPHEGREHLVGPGLSGEGRMFPLPSGQAQSQKRTLGPISFHSLSASSKRHPPALA